MNWKIYENFKRKLDMHSVIIFDGSFLFDPRFDSEALTPKRIIDNETRRFFESVKGPFRDTFRGLH